MAFQNQVQEKLQEVEKCLSCLAVDLVTRAEKKSRLAAVVERQGEHGLFLYRLPGGSTQKDNCLNLETAFPITEDFRFAEDDESRGTQTGPIRLYKLTSKQVSILLELPQGKDKDRFLKELCRTIEIQSRNSSSGLPSTFTWIQDHIETSQTSINPLIESFLDPLSNKDWPFNQITQSDVGRHCPIVKDTDGKGSALKTPTQLGDIQQTETSGRNLDQNVESISDGKLAPYDTIMPSGRSAEGREALIRLIMQQREDEFTDISNYRVFCGTWNTNGQNATYPLQDWLAPPDDRQPPDIYTIGFQELDLRKNAYIFSESLKEDEWFDKVQEALHPEAKYKLVKLIRLVGIMLVVFIREHLSTNLSDVMAETVGTGLMGMMGNKGGVGVRFQLHDTTVCFVSAHLAAHTEECERRNQDFRDITSRMTFTTKDSTLTISDHDVIFWLGDLNYRLDIDVDKAKHLIEAGQIDKLLEYDQLRMQIKNKKAFLDYIEGSVSFIPTYKYETGTDEWATGDKNRTPSWCDRILWRGANINQLVYRSHQQFLLSDHKPVSAVFLLGVKEVNQTLYKKVYEDAMKQMDRRENDFLPQVKLDVTEAYFDNVKFIEQRSRTVTVTNIGQVPVHFEFINKPNDDHYCKPWLCVDPSRGTVAVGQVCELQIEVYVNKNTAPKLNGGEDNIADILVLHLEGGKDFFLSVSGNYLPSCFGSSIDGLVYMYGPIREVPTATLVGLERGSGSRLQSEDQALDIPKEIWRLVDYLYKNGVQESQLFLKPGLHSEIQQIRDCLDTGSPSIIPGTVHSAAEALLMFLEATAEPVIPYTFYPRCLECCSNFFLCKQVLSQVPLCHRNVFKYLCAFLRVILQFSHKNGLEPRSIAAQFGSLLLRAPPDSQNDFCSASRRTQIREDEKKKAAFVYHFLENDYDE